METKEEQPAVASAEGDTESTEGGEEVTFKVVFAKETHLITFGLNKTIAELKKHLEKELNCPAVQQKLMYKGPLNDTDTLKSKNFKKNAKVLLVGATAAQILKVAKDASTDFTKEDTKPGGPKAKEIWAEQHIHKEVLKKGVPASVALGYIPQPGDIEPLPVGQSIQPLYNRRGKLRMKINLDEGTMTIATNERQEHVHISNIQDCEAQAIEGHPGYHILGLQIGSEKSMRFFYWFPSQYVPALKALCGRY
eukprot:m.18875 g.18875  ORF g.18875 m.18875 type:complete len:251 (+) comp6431_c0_seq1:48-800(+)